MQVVLCTCGTGVHVGLSACCTCCVVGMRYYVCALCSHGIVTYAFIVLCYIYVFLLYCTPDVGVCVVCKV